MTDTTVAALALMALAVLMVTPSAVAQWRFRRTRARLRAELLASLECPACGGEGYRYVEQAGRHATHPIAEIRCARCAGTGLARSDA